VSRNSPCGGGRQIPLLFVIRQALLPTGQLALIPAHPEPVAMKKANAIKILLAGAISLAAIPVQAQYEGPGFAACMQYGEKRLLQDGTIRSVVFVNDKDTVIEKYTENVGSQFVSSVLTGKLTIERASGPARKLRYLCLLADDQTPVFFHTSDDKQEP
jgi:hypothetical protein